MIPHFCHFCKLKEETVIHLLCECDVVTPLWDDMSDFNQSKTGEDFQFSNYQKMFGLDFEDSEHKNAINFLILYSKLFIHRCKFQNVNPSFQAYKNFTFVNCGHLKKIFTAP